MIYSMTGYGEASREVGNKVYRIEIRSLNGKNSDIRFKSNANLRDKEISLRKLIKEAGLRGKFDVNLTITSGGEEDSQINKAAMERYYADLTQFAQDKDIGKGDILQTLVRLPNVVQLGEDEVTDEEWDIISSMSQEAMQQLNAFRKTEGDSMDEDLIERISQIRTALSEVDPYEASRITTIKERIKKNLNQHLSDEQVDHNRFEQEVLFYLERLDINEEKVRLSQHCTFFLEELGKQGIQKGKKLNFISQELGREINTLGAKAQHSDIQQLVVKMKDELEKIKELVLNIL